MAAKLKSTTCRWRQEDLDAIDSLMKRWGLVERMQTIRQAIRYAENTSKIEERQHRRKNSQNGS
jgi:hypothetical protein